MRQFNNIPKTGTFGGAVDQINANFYLAYVAIGDVEYETRKNKGLFASADALNAAIPHPTIGDWALVSTGGFPAELYVCNMDDVWTDSQETYDGDNVDFNDYITKAEYNTYKAQIDEELEALDDYDKRLDDLEGMWKYINLADPTKFTSGKYVRYEDGGISNNELYKVTDYIPVTGGLDYYFSFKHQMAWYDEDKNYISGSNSDNKVKIQTAPVNAYFVRANALVTDNEYIVAQSSTPVDYIPYSAVLYTPNGQSITEREIANKAVSENKLNVPTIFTPLGNDAGKATSASLASGSSLTISSYPYFVKKGMCLSLFANVGTFSAIEIGKGYNQFRGRWLKIDGTNIVMQNYTDTVVSGNNIPHGLTIDTFIEVSMCCGDNGKMHVTLQTKGGKFTTEIDWGYEANYAAFVRNDESVLTNVVFNATNLDFRKSVWAFGDSYFGVTNDRVIGQVKNLGFFNFLVDGLAGLGSASAYDDFLRALNFGTPKYLLWCLGMNDTDANHETYFNLVKTKCQKLGITLIGCTIPTVPERSKETISTYVRNNVSRYIDAYTAVGANSSGVWYTGYLSNDNLHPTEAGAKAIAMRWLMDFSELMQYGKYDTELQIEEALNSYNPPSDIVYIDYWQASAPATFTAGLLWYDTTNNLLKKSVSNSSGSTISIIWVTVTPSRNVSYVDLAHKKTYIYNNNVMLAVGGEQEILVTQAQYDALTPEPDTKYVIYETI